MFKSTSVQKHARVLAAALGFSLAAAVAAFAGPGAGAPVMKTNNSNDLLKCVAMVDNDDGTKGKLVECGVSMLSWREKSDSFGRRVADTYVALQVQVTTDDSVDSYHLHYVSMVRPSADGEDSDLGGQVGRNMQIVTAVGQQGQYLTKRNMIARSLDAASTIVGGLTPFSFFTMSFKSAVALFQGPIVNSYKSTFPDFTVGQMSLLNNKSLGMQSDVISRNAPGSMILFYPHANFVKIAALKGKIKMKNVNANFFAQNKMAIEVRVHMGYFQEPPSKDQANPGGDGGGAPSASKTDDGTKPPATPAGSKADAGANAPAAASAPKPEENADAKAKSAASKADPSANPAAASDPGAAKPRAKE